MSYLEVTSSIFTMLRWIVTMALRNLMEAASGGDFCGDIVVTANLGNIKGGLFPVLMGHRFFTQPTYILHKPLSS